MPNEKILVVDDEADVLDLCKRILAANGYQIDSANNGYEAIEIARQRRFDLLLTDIKMPGMSGLEIAQQIKNTDPHVVCVTMTGYSTMDTAINALKLGIDEFIMKPFTPKELGAAVAKALEKERLRKENFRLRSLIPLFELNQTLVSTVDEKTLINRLLEIVQQETEASFAAVFLSGNSRIETVYFHESGLPLNQAVKKASLELATRLLHTDTATKFDLSSEEYGSTLEAMGMTSAMVVPLKSQNSMLGLFIVAQQNMDFAPSDSEFLSVLSGQAGTALENARLFTEIQEAYRQLQQLDYMKSEFINIAAHELRTPLAILMGYAAVLEEAEEEVYGVSLASSISRNAMRLRSLIDDMLNLQYLESGIPTLQQDKVDLEEVVQQITQDVGLLVEEKQLDINIDIVSDFPPLITDRQKLDLILVNLIHNAVKFTPSTGKITVHGYAEDDFANISVHNSGSVIPQEKLSRIFDRFYQIEETLTREHGGAGLGLSIVRGMVDVCGGSIAVESSEEAGTTFSFRLPLDNTHLEARKLKL
jgi:signal transduction histidine kinase/CheY-like chemotaxis protein